MQFMVEPRGSLTISAGDLLITTDWKASAFWVDCTLINDPGDFIITSTSVMNHAGTYKFMDCPKRYIGLDDTFRNIISVSINDDREGVWTPVPTELYPDFAKFIDDNMY